MGEPAPEFSDAVQQALGDQILLWLNANWANLGLGLPSLLLTIAVCEKTKIVPKLYAAAKLQDLYTKHPKIEDLVVWLWSVVCSVPWVLMMDFTSSFNSMVGSRLGFVEGSLLGFVATGSIASFGVWAVKDLDFWGKVRRFLGSAPAEHKKKVRHAAETGSLRLLDHEHDPTSNDNDS